MAVGNTIYTRLVAKVMISIPEALLKRIDARSQEIGETRSGFLQRLAERELELADRRDDEEIKRLLDSINIDLGGADIAQVIREDRESH
ncbi:MAG: type II toxin-antitoxin system HicB family antitoxin [Solirubrobacterales bacterium]